MRLSRVFPQPLFHAFVVVALVLLCITTGPLGDTAHGESQGYWHTRGRQILDDNDQPVRIAGINWYGFETEDRVAQGLYARDYKAILDSIRAHGYNTVRIPFSNQVIEEPVVPTAVSYNNGIAPMNLDLQGLNSLQILDKIVEYSRQIGLRIILDNHRSEAGNSAQASGLWYTDQYPESKWIADWQLLAHRYQKNPAVIGMDLRNEPHNAASSGACWDCGSPARDWHKAAQRAGDAVLAINPRLLIFVEGTDSYNNEYTWWGGDLQGVAHSPVKLQLDHQLVYSAHEYGPAEHAQDWFGPATTHASLAAHFRKNWGYISEQNLAPVWIGEFGTGNASSDVEDALPGSQGQWFQAMLGFLKNNPSIGWTYWALNGTDAYGLLDRQYRLNPASREKQLALATIQSPLPESSMTASAEAAPSPTPASQIRSGTDKGKAATLKCHVTYLKPSEWNNGFTGALTIYNNGHAAISGWKLTWTFPGAVHVTQSWNAAYDQEGTSVQLSNESYNRTIAPGKSVANIGFNASSEGSDENPDAFYLNGSRCN